jgi:hypothetical protein
VLNLIGLGNFIKINMVVGLYQVRFGYCQFKVVGVSLVRSDLVEVS